MRWILWVAATACLLGGLQAPAGVALFLIVGAALFASAGFVALYFERRAAELLFDEAARLEAAWQEHAATGRAPSYVSPEVYFELVAPDFRLVAERQLLVGDWTIDKYLDQEWAPDSLPLVEEFFDVDEPTRSEAPRRSMFQPAGAADPASEKPRTLEPLDGAAWPRCCGQPTRLIALVDANHRAMGATEQPLLRVPPRGAPTILSLAGLADFPEQWPIWPAMGTECVRCGACYAPSNPDFDAAPPPATS